MLRKSNKNQAISSERSFRRAGRLPVRRRGLSLIECLYASAILSFAVLAVTQAVVAGQMQATDALHRARAMQLVEAMMDEVLRLPYADPNGSGGEVGRTNFDNLADYNGHSESATAVSDYSGTLYDAPYQGFSRSVSVVSANGGAGISVTGFGNALPGLTVTVTVQDAAGASWILTRFRAQPPP